MVAELDQFAKMNYPLNHPAYVDGRRREIACMEHFEAVYEAAVRQITDEVAFDPAEHTYIGDETAASLQEQLELQHRHQKAALVRTQRARAEQLERQIQA